MNKEKEIKEEVNPFFKKDISSIINLCFFFLHSSGLLDLGLIGCLSMRLTVDALSFGDEFLNCLGDRELQLRNLQIPLIENLGITKDHFSTLDLSGNLILRLDGSQFPVLTRLRSLVLAENKIARIGGGLGGCLPALETLVLSGNEIRRFEDVAKIAELRNSLVRVSLKGNPVEKLKNYREYMVFMLPKLKSLDFSKVSAEERKRSAELFGDPFERSMEEIRAEKEEDVLTKEQKDSILAAIKNAKSLEEVDRLHLILQSGVLPKEGLRLA